MASSSEAGRRSPDIVRPNMRIVLIGKNGSENSKVENFLKSNSVLDSGASSHVQQPSVRVSGQKTNISVFNTSNLLQTHHTQSQVRQAVSECVSQCAPGPHVFILVLQYGDFTDNDRHRVKYILSLFSEKAIKHTIVLTTDQETHGLFFTSKNNNILNLIEECGGRHLKFDTGNPQFHFELCKKIEKILKEEEEEFLICDMYRETDKAKLNLVLCGNNATLKSSVSTIFRGKLNKLKYIPQKERIKECVKKEGKISGREISVVELPALTRLSEEEVMRETLNCLLLCDPGVHQFIFVTPVTPLTDEERAEMEKIRRTFNSNEHFMVLFTTEHTVDQSVSEFVLSRESQKIVSVYGSWYSVMGIKDSRNTEQVSKLINYIDNKKNEPYSLQMFLRVRRELEEKLRETESQITELQQKINTLERVKLNLVLCGNAEQKSTLSNLILSESSRGSVVSSEFMRGNLEVHGHLINLMELPALSQLSEEEVMRQTLRCVSLCQPGVHLFILIIPDDPLNNEDGAEVQKIHKTLSSRINKHMMVLIKQNSEHQTAELNEETQAVIKSLGGRHHFIGPNTQGSTLMEKIEQMLEENRGQVFSTDTFLEPQMEKLMKYDELKGRIDSLETCFQSGSRDRADEVRIVLLGKTGVGKSATGNTILGREAFISDISQGSVTKDCQKETTEINGRLVTVIDTPALFDTQLSNEETKREISNCISMILPGPHVFLLLIPLGRFTQEEQESVKMIQENFGENSLKYTIVLFTRGDDLKNKTIEHFLGKADCALKILIDQCGNRVHVFNNNQTEDRTQVSDLLMKIDEMVKANGDSFYSCRMFRELEREIQEQKEKILEEKVEQLKREREELMKKHEEEKKRREDQFTEREEQYNRNIKERLEEERKTREELMRERQQRDEEEERRRKREQEMSDEYNQRLKEEKERMKKMMEEREKEFREKEEQNKKELKREREEWQRDKQEDREKRKEDDEMRRKIEKETWNEYYEKFKRERKRRLQEKEDLKSRHEEERQKMKMEKEKERQQLEEEREKMKMEKEKERQKHKDEREKMKMEKEEERQKLEEERKRREEEFRGEEHRRDIKDIENREKEITKMKKERDEWYKVHRKKDRQREETHLSNQRTEGTPELQHTNNEGAPASDPECLRILLFGRTGSGKSATGNTILKKTQFQSEDGSSLVTRVCQRGVGEVGGKPVCVVDTPGLFDKTLSKEQVEEQIMKSVSLSAPGPHVFIIVLNLRRISREERDVLDMINMIFGPKAAKFRIVLFTRGDDLENVTIEQYVEKSKNLELKKLISDCGNRFLAFNNTEDQDQTQVTQLFNMIEDLKKYNQGQYFTNEIFLEDRRMEELKENNRRNQAQVKAKYEMEFRNRKEKLEKKQKTEEEREKLENRFRERAETLRREFEEREKAEQKKQEFEEWKQSKLEKQMREELERRIEDHRIQHEKQQEEREKEEQTIERQYKQDQEKMKNLEQHIEELKIKQEEDNKRRDSEKQKRNEQQEKEREECRRRIKEAESEDEESIEQQLTEWEEENEQQMREREEEERKSREELENQLREKEEELENLRKKSERDREDRQMIEQEREEIEREYEEEIEEVRRHYEQLKEERKEEQKRRKQEDEERREEKSRRWKNMIEDLKRDQEEEIWRRGREERERIKTEEEECKKMKEEHEHEIKTMKKKHQDEVTEQEEELKVVKQRKDQRVQELKDMVTLIYEEECAKWEWSCHIM